LALLQMLLSLRLCSSAAWTCCGMRFLRQNRDDFQLLSRPVNALRCLGPESIDST
jgi:hypothetical protein